MGNWESFNLSSLVPPEVPQAITTLTSIVNQFLTLYKEGLNIAELYQKLLSGDGPDILQVAVQALIDVIEGLFQAGKVHMLFVPMPKRYPDDSGPALPPTIDDIAYDYGFDLQQAGLAFSANAQQAYSSLISDQGGNNGFYRTFIEALNDPLDPNAPQYFSPGDAVTMVVLMCGAPTFAGLVDVATSFNRAFRPQVSGDLTARMVPVPQNLQAFVIALPKATNMGVQLSWDPPQDTYNSPYFPSVNLSVVKYAVIRSTDPRALSASSVLDFFTTRDLTVGLTSTDQAKASKVIAIGTGLNASYVDNDDSLDPTKTYYYCVAWQVQTTERGVVTTLPYDRVSNVVKTTIRYIALSKQATPPNWDARGSLLDIVPDLGVSIRTLLAEIQTLAGRQTGGASGALSATLALVEQNLTEFGNRLDDLNAQAARLNALFATPLPGLYATQITGIGGNAFLAGELAARLNDRTDTSRPPYDDDEYVVGVCLVAGGPRLPDIQPIIDFLAMLFHTTPAENPLMSALNALGGVVQTQETYVFGQNMQALPQNPDGTVTLPDGSTVAANQIDPSTGLPFATNNPVINDAGQAVPANDPSNPNAGNTGVQPTKC